MARIRTIKPEFFKNYKLFKAELESGLPLRLAFSGLWTVADREGRFEWIPEQIKIDVLPYDDMDFSRVMDALWTRGYVEKYAIDEQVFGWIPGFKDHQVINNREKESIIPEPNENNILTRDSRVNHASVTRIRSAQAERKGKEGKGREQGIGAEAPHLELQKLYHEILPELPPIRKWTEKRAKAFRARWRDPQYQSLDFWKRYFEYVRQIPFLMGKNDRGWQADIDFLLREDKIVKAMEGGYERVGGHG